MVVLYTIVKIIVIVSIMFCVLDIVLYALVKSKERKHKIIEGNYKEVDYNKTDETVRKSDSE